MERVLEPADLWVVYVDVYLLLFLFGFLSFSLRARLIILKERVFWSEKKETENKTAGKKSEKITSIPRSFRALG